MDEEGVEAPHPSHPTHELWPPRGLALEIAVVDQHGQRHKELLDRLDHQDEILRRISQLLAQPEDVQWTQDHDYPGLRSDADLSTESPHKPLTFSPEVFHTFTEADLALRHRAEQVDGDISRQLYASTATTEDTASYLRKLGFWERKQLWVRKLVNSNGFDMFFALVVISNSISLGIEVEFNIQYPGATSVALEVAQYVYTVLFTVELLARVAAFGLGYFWSPDWMWALLDSVIVGISLAELVVDIFNKVQASDGVDPAVGSFTGFKALRLIRITRLLKTLRVVRIFRFIMALRTLVTSIVYTLRSLFWALTLLLLIVYVFSVLITQVVNNHVLDELNWPLDEQLEENAQKYFRSLTQTMLSLFMSISGGVSWEELAYPLQAISTLWVMVLLFYVSFTYFAVLNVVTGVFCQSAIDSAQNDHANVVHAMLANKEAHIEKIRNLFSQLGAEKTGVITYAMFEEGMNSPAICEYFETLGLDVWDAWSFFKLLDLDRGGAVEIEEFFKGCLRLRGQARGVDVGKILHDQTWLIKNTGHFQAYMEVRMKQLTEMMSKMTGMAVDNHWTRSDSG